MAEPPKTPPSSDIEGVNRDARAGTPSRDPRPDPGPALSHAEGESKAQPDEGAPVGKSSEGYGQDKR